MLRKFIHGLENVYPHSRDSEGGDHRLVSNFLLVKLDSASPVYKMKSDDF